jgi:hypothetical protein
MNAEDKDTLCYYKLCYFYNTKDELKIIIDYLIECEKQNITLYPYITRVSKPYTDKTKSGKRVEGNWVVIVDFECNTSQNIPVTILSIPMSQGILRRLPTKSKWISIIDEEHNINLNNFLENELANGLCSIAKPNIYADADSFEKMVNTLVSSISTTEEKDMKPLIGTWFMFACSEVFSVDVKLLCGCGELIATNEYVEVVKQSPYTNCFNK